MLLYEMVMVIAIGIVVVLVVATAPLMTGPEKRALLRAGEAAAAQRLLVASPAQQVRDARAAAAGSIRLSVSLLYEDVPAEPLPPRLATLIAQLETQVTA